MLINEHILIAVWIEAWTKTRVRQFYKALEANGFTKDKKPQTVRKLTHNFAQFRRLAHHRYQLWRRQQRSQRSKAVPKTTVHETVESPAAPRLENIGKNDVTQDRLDVKEPGASNHSERQEIKPTSVSELRSPQDTAEHQFEPPRTLDAAPKIVQTKLLEELQGCDQAQSQADEPRLTKEPPSIVPTCDAHEKVIEPQVNSIFPSVTFTDSPSFSTWMPYEKADEHRMSLSNVKFRGFEQCDLQLKSSCEIVNVTFVDCKFNRMAFMDVKLSNVVFKHVDFTDSAHCCLVLRNVTLTCLHFQNDLWRATHSENALVGNPSFIMRKGATADCYLRAPAVSSKTIQLALKDAKSLDKLNQELGHSGAWKHDIHRRLVPSKRSILTRLVGCPDIIDRVMGYCFPGSNIYVYEYPYGFKIPERSTMSTKLYTKRNGTKTTYFGSIKYSSSAIVEPSKRMSSEVSVTALVYSWSTRDFRNWL